MQHIIKEKIVNKVVRKVAGTVYYFDNEGVYRSIPFYKINEKGISIGYVWGGYFSGSNAKEFGILDVENGTLITKIICKMQVGQTLEDLDRYLSTVVLDKHLKPEGVERFVTKVGKPIFERVPENPNPKTFDFIYMRVNIVSEWEEDRKRYIQKNIKQIHQMLLEKLENSGDFQKFGVPLNFLKLTRATLTRDSVIEFVFELKI